MEPAPSRLGLKLGSVSRIALAVGVGVLGVVMVHHPMILSGFRWIQTDLADTRLIHYLLEHGYRWVRREPGHLDFWSPPFFYPAKNVAAYSDVLLSVGPVYWLCRALGASPDLSFGLWMLSMSALNYAAGLLLFRRGLGFGIPAAVAGASLVAFGAPRVNQLGHQQLLPFFFALLTLYALSRLFGDLSLGRAARAGYWLLAMTGVVAQLYAGVYLGWFLIVGLGLAAVLALAMRSCRVVLLEVVRRDTWAIAAAIAGGVLLLRPFLTHYLPAAREVQPEFIIVVRALHPGVWSWFDVGAKNWFWGWAVHPALAAPEWAYVEGEHHLGIGFLTPIACVVGLYLGRKWPICRLAAAAAFMMWFATTYMPGDHLAMLAAGVSCYCAAGLFHEVDQPGVRGIGLAVVLCLLLWIPFPNPDLIVLGLTTSILCFLELGRRRGHLRDLIVPGIALVVISLKFINLGVIPYGIILIAPTAGLVAYWWGSRRWEVGLGSLAILLVFSIVISFSHRPGVLIGALATAPISLAMSAPDRYRPPAWLLLRAMLIALPFLVIFYDRDSLWLAYSGMIPGAKAIRAVGRVVLILLVPAALGLAFLVEFLDQRRLAIASWTVALVCLAEQGMTTETFNAAANRASIESIASRIDRGRVAFYYRPIDGPRFKRDQLDAMWASLAIKVPTINGYSGHSPYSWRHFIEADLNPKVDVADVLARWERSHRLLPDQVQFVNRQSAHQGETSR